MKKSFVLLFGLLLSFGAAHAQDDPAKLSKSAGKALTSYNIDPSGNAGKLEEAKTKINEALKSPEIQASASAWITKGDIYNTIISKEFAMRAINKEAPLSGDNDALVAFEAYKMAYGIPEAKKYEKSDALKGITEIQTYLVNVGGEKYDKAEYAKAFLSFKALLSSHDLLKSGDRKSILDETAQYDNYLYITGLCAALSENMKEAVPLYETLYKKGTEKPEVYSVLYKAKTEAGDIAGAKMILAEGRKKFTNDSGLLFDEINLYLKEGKLDELTGSLKTAISKEPTNVALYVTLGNVYDNLYQAALKSKDDAKTTEYFEEAKKYYTQGAGVDPKNVDAVYSLGALYYNKAAFRTQELNALPEDYSAAGMKKYKDLKAEVLALFDQALPHFQKAESLDSNDTNTLIALTEIYARKEDDLSIEFKKRLTTVKEGGKNPASYFK